MSGRHSPGYQAKWEYERYLKLLGEGKCTRCGGERDNPKRKMCSECREYYSVRREAKKNVVKFVEL